MNTQSFATSLMSQAHLPLPLCRKYSLALDDVLPIICGYLNGDGGWIIVDGSGDEAASIQTAIVEDIAPLPLVYIQLDTLNGHSVVLITVMKGAIAPYTYRGRYYVIEGDVAVVPNSDQLSVLWRNSLPNGTEWESLNCLMAEEEDLDEELINKIYQTGLNSGRVLKADNGLSVLLSNLKLVRTSMITNGAIALLGKDTRNLLPQCRVRIQLMCKGKASKQFDDVQVIEGNIFYALNEVVSYFTERLPWVSSFLANSTSRYEDYIYPLDVIDEAVSNALIHRDYSNRSGEITIFIFSDRIEITNPGMLPDKMVEGKNKVLNHGSILRNPLMAEVFYIAGQMEKTGRGMLLISSKMKELGKKLPEWTCANGMTTLKIFSEENRIILHERSVSFLRGKEVGDRFKRIDYMDALGNSISERTAKLDIAAMVDGGWCVQEGNGPATKYVRTNKMLPDVAR